MDIDTGPFRGSEAIRAGLVTERVLRGPRFRRLFSDIYLAAHLPADLRNRSLGAALLGHGPVVLSGFSAAYLLGADCAPSHASAEVTAPGSYLPERPGLTVHRDRLADDEVAAVGGVAVTSALRTAWDLARWQPTVEAVVAVDALARTGGFPPSRLLRLQARYPRARWRRRVGGVIDLTDPLAESPMETRARLVIVLRGLPRPVLQHKVRDARGKVLARLDMAYPELRLGIEYDGRGHLEAWEQQHDARRQNALDAAGWTLLRFTSRDVLREPDVMARRVSDSIARRSRRRFAP